MLRGDEGFWWATGLPQILDGGLGCEAWVREDSLGKRTGYMARGEAVPVKILGLGRTGKRPRVRVRSKRYRIFCGHKMLVPATLGGRGNGDDTR